MITLYRPDDTSFASNGIAVLQPVRCVVEERINGDYYVEMDCPIDDDGIWNEIEIDRIIGLPGSRGLREPFRIYRVEKSMTGMLSVSARHLSYDLADFLIVNQAPSGSANSALLNALQGTGFAGTSNVGGSNAVRWVRKSVLSAIMGDDDNSILNRWGGEVERVGQAINVMGRVGRDNNVGIRYRKNLTGLDMSIDASDIATRIMPTGLKENDAVLELPERYIDSPHINDYARIKVIHVHFGDIRVNESAENPDDIVTTAQAYAMLRDRVREMYENGIDLPKLSAEVRFVDLSTTVEHEEYAHMEEVRIGDTVHVWHEGLSADLTARVVSATWDAIDEKFISLVLGADELNLTNVLSSRDTIIRKEIEVVKQAADEATEMLLSGGDSFVRFKPSLGSPSEIFFLDNEDENAAMNVMRMNRNGWGLSTTGINGPFRTAATPLGIVADQITAGQLNAGLIKIAGTDGTFWDDNYIQITDRTNPNRIMRYGRYDGVNSGLAFSTNGGATWGTAVSFDGAQFGDSIAGFRITTNGFTSISNNVQIRPNGNFRFGSVEMNTTDFSPLTRFICWNGSNESFSVLGQTTQVFGYLVLSGLPTTSNKPNLYIDANGTVYRSTATW